MKKSNEDKIFACIPQNEKNEIVCLSIFRFLEEHINYSDRVLIGSDINNTIDLQKSFSIRNNKNVYYLSFSDEYTKTLIRDLGINRKNIIQCKPDFESINNELNKYDKFDIGVMLSNIYMQGDMKTKDGRESKGAIYFNDFSKLLKNHFNRYITMYNADFIFNKHRTYEFINRIQKNIFNVELVDVDGGDPLKGEHNHRPCAIIYVDNNKVNETRNIHVIDHLSRSIYDAEFEKINQLGKVGIELFKSNFWKNVIHKCIQGRHFGTLKEYDDSLSEANKTNGSILNIRNSTGSAYYYKADYDSGMMIPNTSGMAVFIGKDKNANAMASLFLDHTNSKYHRRLVNPHENKNAISYLKTKPIRAILFLIKSGYLNLSQDLTYIPLVDFSHEWTDDMVYDEFNAEFSIRELINKVIPTWYSDIK